MNHNLIIPRLALKAVASALILLPILLSSCTAAKQRLKPLEDHVLKPFNVPLKGYSISGNYAVYEDNTKRLMARHVPHGDTALPSPIEQLAKNKFVIVELTIENKSKKEIIYKPNYTTLRTKDNDYLKPNDYTDLYSIFSKIRADEPVERTLNSLSGSYYDLDITIMPGKKVARFLIFGALFNPQNKMIAGITIDNIYVGTDTSDVTFAFEVLDAKKTQK